MGRIRRIFLRSSTPSTEQHENEATGNDTHRAFVKPTSQGTSVDAESDDQNETQNITSSTTSNATGNDAHRAIVKSTSQGTSVDAESDDQNETQNITSSTTSNGKTDPNADDPRFWKFGNTLKKKKSGKEYTFIGDTCLSYDVACSDSKGKCVLIDPSKLRRSKISEFDGAEIEKGDKVELLVNYGKNKMGQEGTVIKRVYQAQTDGKANTCDKFSVKFPDDEEEYQMHRYLLRKLNK